MRVAYLNIFNYAPFKDKGDVVKKPAVFKVWLASAYIPVIGTISQVALLVLYAASDIEEKKFKEHFSVYPMLALRVTLTLVPLLLLAIDVITTIVQASINKKEPKMLARVHY